jgi:signal recognition particle subunit SRP54
LRGKGKLSEEDVKEALREVRLALLEADVNFKVVKEFIARIQERATGTEVFEALTGAQTVVKLVHDELIELLGGEQTKFEFELKPPTIVMMCGLQGSGKTTTCGKLAMWSRKQGRNPLLVACDIYRPAAIKQLEVLGKQLNIPVYSPSEGVAPPEIARQAVRNAAERGLDVIILDTAGRLHIDEELMQELENIRKAVQISQILLVVDAMTGQDAVNFAQEFHSRLQTDGIVMTKLDGDARGGAALSTRSVTGVPIKFIGVGEKLDALEPFYPDRMASRILGMGDVLSLIERAQESIDETKAKELEQRLKQNQFDLNDFLEQLQQMKKMGPLENILKMLPGVGSAMKDVQVDDSILARQEAIVRSMTLEERSDPSLLNGSRKRRISRGSGMTVQEINQFLTQFEQMRAMVKQFMGKGGMMNKMNKKRRMPFSRGR